MQDDERDIRTLIATWVAATEAGDSAAILRLICDDAVFLTPGAPPMSKSDFAAAQAGLSQVQLRITSAIREIRIMGAWAYCWNHLKVTAIPRGGAAPVARSGNSLSILQKQAGSWLLVRDANMLTVDP